MWEHQGQTLPTDAMITRREVFHDVNEKQVCFLHVKPAHINFYSKRIENSL